ncbi:Winged helix-turn-helix DNA-binding domain protein [Acididesulfobacillus acetoxydans]|uniref:Winged helix-turn-helix DNA-binding domain protein n=1 Tax=Acididesulfobacillus acetoxydans TaxID=1561005 RepID=A0A8S0X1L1_9FIRM|nr:hypothetical protein [Acididesulfobacillus acetoxydans]CAA7603211.1 Winged helix-turn-helix DNA-binding domain protein [Acididesulfobacillus acetoxydans]
MPVNGAEITLKELISDAFLKGAGRDRFGRNRRELESEANNMAAWFQNYYGGTEDGSEEKRLNILDTSLREIRANQGEFTAEIENGIRSHPGAKVKQAAKLGFLIDHLNRKYDLECDVSFVDKFKQEDRSIRLLEILKYLHSGSKTREEIAAKFDISERLLSEDLKTLRKGFEFMGTKIQISGELKRKVNTYESPIHPVFLALNSAEIYALTLGLKLLTENTIFQQTLGRVSDLIYLQLSDFARELIDSQPEAKEIEFKGEERKFLSSLQMVGSYDRPFSQYIKSQRVCLVKYFLNEEEKTVKGTLHLAPKNSGRFQSICVQSAEGSLIIPIDDIAGIY